MQVTYEKLACLLQTPEQTDPFAVWLNKLDNLNMAQEEVYYPAELFGLGGDDTESSGSSESDVEGKDEVMSISVVDNTDTSGPSRPHSGSRKAKNAKGG